MRPDREADHRVRSLCHGFPGLHSGRKLDDHRVQCGAKHLVHISKLGLQTCPRVLTDLKAHQQLLVRNDEKRKDGTVHVTFENRLRAMELLMKHLGLLKDQMRLEVASGLTLEEEEKIAAFSDQELLAWNEANDVIYYLLHPDETPGEVVPAGLLPARSQA